MGILSSLFGIKKKENINDMPPIYGGDGLSEYSPAIINCASMDMANHLIDKFISEKCGTGWEKGIEFTIAAPDNSEKSLKAINIKQSNGAKACFYFDLSRPITNAMKMLGM
tara:strand:- start:34 stop:366 length:333 start_codon:yes stop_codon:yes gene_type:complete